MDPGDLLPVPFVGHRRGVEVAVAGMAEGGDADPVFLAQALDLGEGFGEAAPGHGGVFEDGGRRHAGDGRKGGPPRGGEL